MPKVEKLEMCKFGYHAAPEDHLIEWCYGPHLYEFEGRGEMLQGGNKVAFGEARLVKEIPEWNRKTAVLFACDCAEHVLHLFEERYPKDKRPREAIQAAREYVDGKITIEELRKAAWAADAATRAAWAADAAAWAAWAADAARAARAAARAARTADAAEVAYEAAWAAAGATWAARAAEAAERKWQNDLLLKMLGLK
jgi:hypothetical protein